MKKQIAMWALASFLAVPASQSMAEGYPNQPVRLLVPYAPGGTTDLLARVVAKELGARLAGNVIVENRTGAGGNIAAAALARSQPDGYTLMMASVGQFAINPLIFSKPGYDAARDFTPVASVAEVPNVLVVNKTSPLHSIQDLIAQARTKPGQLTFASSGNGSSNHLAGVLFSSMAKVDSLHVPYKGSAPGVQALYAGDVSMMFDNLSSSLSHIRSGELRALGVTSTARVAQLPDVPTIAEAGLAGYEASAWFGIVAPAGIQAAISDRLNAEINAVLNSDAIRGQLIDMGMTPIPASREAFQARIDADMAKWAPVVRNANLVIN
ncbi:MAG: Bug family tripartite tricarboxylate transporter substrate binding protein [Achromobacter veterisilvae]